MKKLHKVFSFLLPVFLLFPLVPSPAAQAKGAVISVANWGDVRAALEQAVAGDIIEITGTGSVNDTQSDSAPWVIDKAVTIRGTEGAALEVRAGGVVLGADVTFENLTLSFPNRVRNAIMANGYTLHLTEVACSSNVLHKIHLFCGSLTTSTPTVRIPASGPHGNIILENCTNFGNIYAGSISGDGKQNSFASPATVTIRSGEGVSFGTMYGCGALETYVDQNKWFDTTYEVDPPTANPQQYQMAGTVQFNLYYNTVSEVDGATGSGKNAAVTYSAGAFLNASLALKNISSLTLAGDANLQLAASSAFQEPIAVSVPNNTTLNLSQLPDRLTLANFHGGGSLVLGQKQTLTINGSVNGTTKLGVGKIFNGASDPVELGHAYVTAPQSVESSFVLASPNIPAQQDAVLTRDDKGVWTISTGEERPILVETFSMKDLSASTSNTAVELPLNVTYAAASANVSFLDFVPLGITVNNSEARRTVQEDSYLYDWSLGTLTMEVAGDRLHVTGENQDGSLKPGVYKISISIPGQNTVTGKTLSATATLTVSNSEGGPISIAAPTAASGLRYTGLEQTGVPEGDGYLLSGRYQATEVGSYTVTATLKNGYQWNDGTNTPKTILWSIGKKESPTGPTGVKPIPPSAEDLSDGKIIGVDSTMEYSADKDFANAKPCTAKELTGLSPGTYYIRVKETSTQEAGKAISVIVPAFGSSEDGSGEDGEDQEENTTPVPSITIPVSGEQGSVQVDASVSGSTVTIIEIGTTQIDNVMGGSIKTGVLQIDLSGLKDKINTVKLPADVIRQIAEAGQSNSNRVKGLAVKLSTGEIAFDNTALAALQAQTDKQLVLAIIPSDDAGLTPAQKKAAGDAQVFNLTLRSGGKTVTGFRGGEATISLPYQLKPEQQPSGVTAYYLDNDGKTFSCKTKYDAQTKKAVFTTSHLSFYFVGYDPAAEWKKPFPDVTEGDWYYEAVRFVQEKGWMNGHDNGSFDPAGQLTRAHSVQLLYNRHGKPAVNGTEMFADVEKGMWYTDAITWATEEQLVEGYDNGLFRPNNKITREQLTVILWRQAGCPQATNKKLDFSDGSAASGWAVDALCWAIENDVIHGKTNTILDPQGTATRAEAATLFFRLAK